MKPAHTNDGRKLPWTRLILALAGLITVQVTWRWAVEHLYKLPPETLAAFQAITTHTLYVTGVIVVWAITGKLLWDWKNQSQSVAQSVAETLVERTPKAKHFDDDQIP